MNLLENIKALCKENNISQRKLEKDLDLSNGSSSKWAKSSPSTDVLQKIADYFDVSIDYLTGKSEYKNFNEELAAKYNTDQLSKESALYDIINFDKSDIVNIPIVGSVRAGAPILAQDNIEGYHPTLKSHTCRDKDYFYLRVQGDSMNQEFNDGSLLLIEKCDDVENGTIAVILIDGMEATVKKVVKNENMITLIPMSTNPIYVPKMYDVVKDEIQIIGKVKEATKIY